MTSLSQATGQNITTSGAEEDPSHCIVQIENRPTSPKRLTKQVSIFRVLRSLVQANEAAYKPKIVSIGPYHYSDGEDYLQEFQETKVRYLDIFLSKTNENGVCLADLREVVSGLEPRIRNSYSEDLNFDREKLIDMMVLDGCFILTLFLVVSEQSWYKNFIGDPVFTSNRYLPTLQIDLILLENQVPLFLLQELLITSKLFLSTSLNQFIFEFFGYSIVRSKEFWKEKENLRGRHLLDLIRKTFIPNQSQHHQPNKHFSHRPHLRLIASAERLQREGIKFKLKEGYDTPLDITVKKGVLKIPKLTFDDFFSTLLVNGVVFEQCHKGCTMEMTSYATFMSCLISNEADVTLLSEKNIIEKYFATREQLTLFLRNIGKEIYLNIGKSYLANVFEGINAYISKRYRAQWAGFKSKHFSSSWAFLSSCAALILLLLTSIQTFFAAYSYFRPPK